MDVYIFGAGASAAEGAPATSDFLPTAWRLFGSDADQRIGSVWRFLGWLSGRGITDQGSFEHLPALDQIFSMVDWSLHADQGLGPEFDPARLRQVRRDLEHLVAATLEASLSRRAGGAPGPHRLFAEALALRSPDQPYALISLNYDTLLDDALRLVGSPPDYGFGQRESVQGGPQLLKLHGSLNWVHCKACDWVGATRGDVAHLFPTGPALTCAQCGSTRLDGLLISPTLLKQPLPLPLQSAWEMAFQALRRAERLVFVGYSLPPADVAVLHLLQRALMTRRGPGRPAIEVINHSDRTVGHFRRLFGPGINFDLSGFQGQA